MAKAEYVTFQGKAKWVKVFKPNQFDKWSVDLYIDDTQAERFKSYKTRTHLRKDEDGYYVSFSRPVEKMIRGKRTALRPPTVTDKDSVPMFDTPIGNGSDLTVTCELYSYKPPLKQEREYAIRLLGIRVDNLVPFVKSSYEEEDLIVVNELDKQPAIVQPSW